MGLVKALEVESLPPGRGTVVVLNRNEYAVFNVGGNYYCIDNACPHRDGPLGEGDLEGETIYCPWHFWEFNVKTGKGQYPGCNLTTYPCKIEGDTVLVELPD